MVIQLVIPVTAITLPVFNATDYELVSLDFNGQVTSTISFGALIDYGKGDTVTNKLFMNIVIWTIVLCLVALGLASLVYVCSNKVKKSLMEKDRNSKIELGLLGKKTKGKL